MLCNQQREDAIGELKGRRDGKVFAEWGDGRCERKSRRSNASALRCLCLVFVSFGTRTGRPNKASRSCSWRCNVLMNHSRIVLLKLEAKPEDQHSITASQERSHSLGERRSWTTEQRRRRRRTNRKKRKMCAAGVEGKEMRVKKGRKLSFGLGWRGQGAGLVE